MNLARPCLIGVVHLPPLPGSPGWGGDMAAVIDRAVADARVYADTGFSAVIIENFGDTPFYAETVPAETVAAMARAAVAVREAIGEKVPLGFNVLRNDAAAALGLCAACAGAFLRVNVHTGAMVTDQGIIQGRAAETLRRRDALRFGENAAPLILADVLVKHAAPLGAIDAAQAARDTFHRGHADALVVTGPGTGEATPLGRLRAVRDAVPEAPLFAGSGVTAETLVETLALADGVIVGSSLKFDGQVLNPVHPARAEKFAAAAARAKRG
ncbi:MAG: BtpA/SgcQ family protein [Verrucomicrobiae bacterium]|nr:BtpA/SgcQ family protein [Verrucomicrobiae bacterium]